MQDDKTSTAGSETEALQTDWADLRAQAEKLGISLSEFQQRDREKKLRQAKKNQGRAPIPASDTPVKP